MTAIWWVVLALVLLLVEMATPGLFFFACLAAGALVAALAAWMGTGPLWTWGVFLGSSTLSVLIVAPLARRWMKRQHTPSVGLDALAGQRAKVVEAIDPDHGKGQVRLENGALWRASCDRPVPADTWVHIVEICGTRLRVEPESATKEV